MIAGGDCMMIWATCFMRWQETIRSITICITFLHHGETAIEAILLRFFRVLR